MALCESNNDMRWHCLLNTLAPLETGFGRSKHDKAARKLHGKGIDRKSLKHKIPRKKIITQKTCLALIDVAKENGDNEMEKSYRNSYYCLNHLQTQNGKAHGKFCKNRFCLVCMSIRKAKHINRLLPVVQKWDDPYFVTLTCKSQKRLNLKKWIKALSRAFNLIIDRLTKRYYRGKGSKPIGIRCLECNFNPIKGTYNPHLHLIVVSKEMAKVFIQEWLKTWTAKFTHPDAQDMRPIAKSIDDLKETIKYGAKIFTDPDMVKNKRSKSPKIYAAALHQIYKAMKGRNLISTFGFKQTKILDSPPDLSTNMDDCIQEWFYEKSITDWVNSDTGQVMTQYKVGGKLNWILENRMDKETR